MADDRYSPLVLSDLSDSELCAEIRKRNNDALSVLLHRYSERVSIKARTFYCRGLDSDDLYQEGMMALINAAVTYDETKSVSFKTYSTVCITNRFRDLLRKSGVVPPTVSLEDAEYVRSGSPEDQIIVRDELDRLKNLMDSGLSAKERSIILDYLSGLSYAEIAEKRGCDVKSVNNTLCRVRKKLKHSE